MKSLGSFLGCLSSYDGYIIFVEPISISGPEVTFGTHSFPLMTTHDQNTVGYFLALSFQF